MRRRALIGCGVIGGALVWLHLAHALAGHGAFVRFGPPLAAMLALGCSWALVPRANGDAAVRWRRVGVASGLVGLLVVPEWIEGELRSGHGVSLATIGDHGTETAIVLGSALAAVMLLEARRVARLL